MKRVMLGMVLVLSVSTWASAESSVWKAQKDSSIFYLGGTVHILREADYPLPPEFEKAYKASDIVVFETDMGKLQDVSTQRKMLAKATYADGSTIDKHLSARTYSQLSAYCASNGVPLGAFSQIKPSMLMVTLTLMELMKLGVTQHGVDFYFYERANKDRKIVKGLETVEEQIDYIVSLADGSEDEFIAHSIDEMKTIRQNFDALARAWRNGDAGKLNELMISDMKARQPSLYNKLIIERNKSWLPCIDDYKKTPSVEFILVGVAHLVGPDGVIEALKKRGYTIDKL